MFEENIATHVNDQVSGPDPSAASKPTCLNMETIDVTCLKNPIPRNGKHGQSLHLESSVRLSGELLLLMGNPPKVNQELA